MNFPFHAIYTSCTVPVRTNIKLGYNSENKNERDIILGGPYRLFIGLSIARCPHFEILPGKNPHGLTFPFHAIYTSCTVPVRTNIKLGYNSENKNERDIILGGPYRPFIGLSIARCPHFEILPGKKSARFEFPVPCYIYRYKLYCTGENEYQTGL